jgi:dipeptidyl-peptidase-4
VAEKARRERMRITARGIVRYSWSKDGGKLLFPLGGDLYQYNLKAAKAKRLTNSKAYEVDSRFSPKGTYVSYTMDGEIYIVNAGSGQAQQLTNTATDTIKNGTAEFVAMEEMGRSTGYWWSPDEKYMAYISYDESPVDIGRRYEINRDSFAVLEQRYPSAGTNNVHLSLGIMELGTGKTKWVNLGSDKDIYLPRVKWLPDSSGVFFQRQDRAQKNLDLIFADAKSAKSKLVFTEKAKYWTQLHNTLKFINNSSEFIWASERSGYSHLYHYKRNGELISQLTAGDWKVTSIPFVNEDKGEIYFTATQSSVLERHLYKISIGSKKVTHPQRITKRAGMHRISFPKGGEGLYLDNFSNPATPSNMSLHKLDGSHVMWISENKMDKNHPYYKYMDAHIMPEFGTVIAADGKTTLHYKMLKPKNMLKGKKYPVLFSLYGGPGPQRVSKSWSGADWTQYLAQQGYIVFTLDNRGSGHRGVEFKGALYHHLGEVEVQDQLKGYEFLKTLPYVDAGRIGIQGHSYGGYMTLMAMFKAPDVFKVGISGAPVTEWRLYDTHYTERFLGHPITNKKGYDASSVFPYVKGLKGKLLIAHGMADDNVVFNHASMLFDELQKNAVQFDMMVYPGETHRLGSDRMRRRHLYQTYKRYLDDHLMK